MAKNTKYAVSSIFYHYGRRSTPSTNITLMGYSDSIDPNDIQEILFKDAERIFKIRHNVEPGKFVFNIEKKYRKTKLECSVTVKKVDSIITDDLYNLHETFYYRVDRIEKLR